MRSNVFLLFIWCILKLLIWNGIILKYFKLDLWFECRAVKQVNSWWTTRTSSSFYWLNLIILLAHFNLNPEADQTENINPSDERVDARLLPMEQQKCKVHKSRMRGRLRGGRLMSEHMQTPSRGQTYTYRNVGGRVIIDMWGLHTCCRWHTPAGMPLKISILHFHHQTTLNSWNENDLVSRLIPTGHT